MILLNRHYPTEEKVIKIDKRVLVCDKIRTKSELTDRICYVTFKEKLKKKATIGLALMVAGLGGFIYEHYFSYKKHH
jgi:hypothetical protein